MTSVLQQHRIRKRRGFIRKTLVRVGAVLAMFVCVITILLSLPQLAFHRVIVSGNESVPSRDITHVTEELLNEKVFYLFPRRNVFLFHPRAATARILSAFPMFSGVDVSRSLREGITISVREREQLGVYCAVHPAEETNGSVPEPDPACFYIAADGTLFAEAPTFTGGILFRVIDMRARSEEQNVGNHAVAEGSIHRVQEIAAWFSEHYQGVLQEVILGRPYEGDMELITSEGWYMRLDERTCIPCALEDLSLVFEKQVTDRSDLEYVDIRFEGKMFYKLR